MLLPCPSPPRDTQHWAFIYFPVLQCLLLSPDLPRLLRSSRVPWEEPKGRVPGAPCTKTPPPASIQTLRRFDCSLGVGGAFPAGARRIRSALSKWHARLCRRGRFAVFNLSWWLWHSHAGVSALQTNAAVAGQGFLLPACLLPAPPPFPAIPFHKPVGIIHLPQLGGWWEYRVG